MNINQFMPTVVDTPELAVETIAEFLDRRTKTFRGFASVEENRGMIRPEASLNSSHGQEMLRLLMFRVIEECVESANSTDPAHIKEEAIDAINYLWSILVLDSTRYNRQHIVGQLYLAFTEPGVATRLTLIDRPRMTLSDEDVGLVASWLAGDVGDLMRNRAWMNNAQDIYFQGTDALELAILRVTVLLYSLFEGWGEFAAFYIAKDEVLQFRLRSRY